MEIKGIISIGENKSLTCCSSIQDILIDNSSLYEELYSFFNLDARDDCNKPPKCYSMRYVISDKPMEETNDFDELVAITVMGYLSSEYYSGCYSEWTCGFGGFDYVNNQGHSIFNELVSNEGKYIHLELKNVW